MLVKIDSRVGSKHLVPLLQELVSVDRRVDYTIEETKLDAADIAWEAEGENGQVISVGVELCRVEDLLAKIETKRFVEEQVPKLLDQYKVVYLLVEGRWLVNEDGTLDILGGQVGYKGWMPAKWRKSGFLYRSVNNFLLSMASFPRVIVCRTNDTKETVQWLKSTLDWWAKGWDEHQSFNAWSGVTLLGSILRFRTPTLLEKVVAQLPGIGEKKVLAVAKKFGSIKNMVNASIEEWIGIRSEKKTKTGQESPAISHKQAESIIKAIEEKVN